MSFKDQNFIEQTPAEETFPSPTWWNLCVKFKIKYPWNCLFSQIHFFFHLNLLEFGFSPLFMLILPSESVSSTDVSPCLSLARVCALQIEMMATEFIIQRVTSRTEADGNGPALYFAVSDELCHFLPNFAGFLGRRLPREWPWMVFGSSWTGLFVEWHTGGLTPPGERSPPTKNLLFFLLKTEYHFNLMVNSVIFSIEP